MENTNNVAANAHTKEVRDVGANVRRLPVSSETKSNHNTIGST